MTFDKEKSTKEMIAEAYQAALEGIRERNRLMETPAALAEKEKAGEKLRRVEELLKLGILNTAVTGAYEGLGERIREKKTALEKLYGINVCEESLQAVREASSKAFVLLAEEYEQAETEYRTTLAGMESETAEQEEKLRAEAEERIASLREELKQLEVSSRTDFEREQAEYNYNQKRERKAAAEKRSAVIAEREQKLTLREETAREKRDHLQKRMDEIADMQSAVNGIPERLDVARQNGAKQAEKLLNKSYSYERALSDKDEELKLLALKAQYERLSEKYKILSEEKAAISKRLDQCNSESRALTSDTVRSIGGINILNAEPHPYAAAKK